MTAPVTSSTTTTSTGGASSIPRWLRHYLTGITAIATGFLLLHYGQAGTGEAAIVSGLAFLGVGAGAASATP